MQAPEEGIFQHHIIIAGSDIDELGHVNNIVYVRWVQEAAAAHWDYLAPGDVKAETAWVVIRHEIDYLYPAVMGDHIIATTWVGENNGATSFRYVDVRREDGKILAKAKTTWCLLGTHNMRPKRIDEKMLEILSKK